MDWKSVISFYSDLPRLAFSIVFAIQIWGALLVAYWLSRKAKIEKQVNNVDNRSQNVRNPVSPTYKPNKTGANRQNKNSLEKLNRGE